MKHLSSTYKVFTNQTTLISVGVGFACLFLISAFFGFTHSSGTSRISASTASQMPTMFAKAQAQFLVTDDTFNTALTAQTHSHSMQQFNIVHAQIAFDHNLRILHRMIDDLRVTADDMGERKALHQLDSDLLAYESLTRNTTSAGSDSTTLAVNAVNEDFDALENLAADIAKNEHDQIFSFALQGRVTLIAFAVCTLILTALGTLQVRRAAAQRSDKMGSLLPTHLSITPLDIVAEQSAAAVAPPVPEPIAPEPAAVAPVPEPIAEREPQAEPLAESEPEPIAEPQSESIAESQTEPEQVEPIEEIVQVDLGERPKAEILAQEAIGESEQPDEAFEPQPQDAVADTLESDTTIIEQLTEKSQQLVEQLSALNEVADSTMTLANSVVNAIDKSPERADLEHVTTNLHALATAMLTTVQQLSSNTVTMQRQVAQIIESLDRVSQTTDLEV